MRTIEKILQYKAIQDDRIELLRQGGFYNGTGADGVFFDTLINDIFEILEELKVFDPLQGIELRNDITQLVVRHDIDTGFKIGFFRANWRLAYGLYKLLHRFGFKISFTIGAMVFYAVHFTKKARKNYER